MLDHIWFIKNELREEKGAAFIMTLILLAVVGVLAVTFLIVSQSTTSIAHRQLDLKRAFWAAEAGVEHLKSSFSESSNNDGLKLGAVNDGTFDLSANMYDYEGGGYKIIEIAQNGNIIETFAEEETAKVIEKNGHEIKIDKREVDLNQPITFVSEGKYNGATESIEIDLILEEGEVTVPGAVDEPWQLIAENEVNKVLNIKRNAEDFDFGPNWVNIEIDEDEFDKDIDRLNEKSLEHEFLTDFDDKENLAVDDYPDDPKITWYEEDGYFKVEYDISEAPKTSHEYNMRVKFSLNKDLDGEEVPLKVGYRIEGHPGEAKSQGGNEEGDTQNENKKDNKIVEVNETRVADRVFGDEEIIFSENLFNINDDGDIWPDSSELKEILSANSLEDPVIDQGFYIKEICSRLNINETNIQGSVLYFKGDLTIEGFSSMKDGDLSNSRIFVGGDVNIAGAPKGEIENSAFFIKGDINDISGDTSEWEDNLLPPDENEIDPDTYTDTFEIENFTNWRVSR